LPEQARIIEGRVIPWYVAGGSDAVLALLVLEKQGGHAYRFLLNPFATEDAPFILSEPIFESEGEPFRIVDVHATGSTADGVVITLRRGPIWKRAPLDGVEELLYVDSCTSDGTAGSRLYDLRSGEALSPR
jgi:hypothetical protein